MASRRQPQDPQGKKARAFQRWLSRNPNHRKRHLENRLADEYEADHVLGGVALGLLVFAIVALALGRMVGCAPFMHP